MNSSNTSGKLFSLVASLLFAVGLSGQTILLNENFNSFNVGNLDGQGGFDKLNAAHGSIQVGNGPANFDPANTTRVVTNAGGTGSEVRTAARSVGFGFENFTSATFGFDFAVDGIATFTGVSIGGNSVGAINVVDGVGFTTSSSVGVKTLNFRRLVLSGDQITMTDISGTNFTYDNNVWYRLEANIDLVAGQISSVFVTNLETTAVSQLYFGAGNASLDLDIASADFSRVAIRVTNDSAGNKAYVDNILVTAIPEPATYVMLLGLFAGIFVAYRRLRLR
jgi:hypothetical protein